MGFMLRQGETLTLKGRRITVTPLLAMVAPQVRDHLIEVAQRRGTITYGELKADLGLPHPPNGLGRVLDAVSEDCFRRDEPSLAPLVVNGDTGEVGEDYDGDPVADRALLYEHWAR